MICYDTIQYDTVQYDTIRYDTMRYDTVRYDTIQHDGEFIHTSIVSQLRRDRSLDKKAKFK